MPETPQKRRNGRSTATLDAPSAKHQRPGQRERLIASMVELSGQRGYPNVSIADVSANAGVSSATFYEQFGDKEDCLLAAYRACTSAVLGQVPPLNGSGADGQETARSFVLALLGALEHAPDAGRLMLVEALAGGARVRSERELGIAAFEARARELLEAAHRGGKSLDLPPDMVVGALRSLVSHNLRTHSEDRLAMLLDDVMTWIESYGVPADESLWSTGPRTLLPARVAQRWLAAATPPPPPERLPRGRHGLPAAAVARSQWTRIIHGTSEVIVAKGYAATTVSDIVAAAGISRDVFYAHFSNKHEAYLAAQQYGTQNLLEACAAAYFAGKTLSERVWYALRALILAAAANPNLTHLRIVECYAAGSAAIEQTEQLKRAAVIFLQEGFTVRPQAARIPLLAAHAITGAVFEAIYRLAAGQELDALPRQLPLFSYLATAPFIGPKRAIAAVERLSAEATRSVPG